MPTKHAHCMLFAWKTLENNFKYIEFSLNQAQKENNLLFFFFFFCVRAAFSYKTRDSNRGDSIFRTLHLTFCKINNNFSSQPRCQNSQIHNTSSVSNKSGVLMTEVTTLLVDNNIEIFFNPIFFFLTQFIPQVSTITILFIYTSSALSDKFDLKGMRDWNLRLASYRDKYRTNNTTLL